MDCGSETETTPIKKDRGGSIGSEARTKQTNQRTWFDIMNQTKKDEEGGSNGERDRET